MHNRVAVIYDGSIRDNGTPRLFREAFAEVLGRAVPWYTQASPIPTTEAFRLHIDDGRDDLTALPPSPWGFYCTDSHLGPGPRLEKARKADIVWCAQLDFAAQLQAEGINAHWLPLACSPRNHPSAVEVEEEEFREGRRFRDGDGNPIFEKPYDVAFVGHLQPPDQTTRIAFLSAIARAVPNFRYEFSVFGRHMAKVYHKARIGINHAVRNDLNMRTFELASIGVPQLCDQRMLGLKEIGFEPWLHYIPYGGPWKNEEIALDAIEAVKWALTNHGGLPAMAKRAKDLVRAEHTYARRVRQILVDASRLIGVDLCESSVDALPADFSTTPTTTTTRNALAVETL